MLVLRLITPVVALSVRPVVLLNVPPVVPVTVGVALVPPAQSVALAYEKVAVVAAEMVTVAVAVAAAQLPAAAIVLVTV